MKQLTAPDAAHKVFDELNTAHEHLTTHEAHKDSESAVYGPQRGRTVSLFDFPNRAIAAFAKSDKHGEPLSDLCKGMVLLTKG